MKKYVINSVHIISLCLLSLLCTHNASAQITTYPYVEDFESGPAGWTVEGVNTSWELGIPSGSYIDSAASGENAWVTNLSGNNFSNEFGWVVSPVFDISSLTTPYLQFNYWLDCAVPDAATIQTSIDNGANWNTLISTGADIPSGEIINWMNVSGNIGSLNTSGWSGLSNGWKTGIYPLEDFLGEESVKFRIVFGSNDFDQFNGFAFDRFQISDTYCYAGEDEDYYNDDEDSNWLTCIENGNNVNLNSLIDTAGRDTNVFARRWQFIRGPIGPRGPRILTVSDDEEEDVDFPNTGSGLGELFTFKYIVEDGLCQDSAEINICMNSDEAASYDFETIYICPGESITNVNELFNAFSLSEIRDLEGYWEDGNFNDLQFPISESTYYDYYDSTANQLNITIDEIDCSNQDIAFTFANAQNTNDGFYDYYEVDVMIETTDIGSSFKLGDGKLVFNYNEAAFGKYLQAYKNVEVFAPDSYIAGQTIDVDPTQKIYSNLRVLDNTNDIDVSRFSVSFKQRFSSSTFASNNVSNTPTKLCHIKIRYEDIHLDPMLSFESGGIYDNKFTTATICGLVNAAGDEITNCLPELKTLIINDTFDSLGATLSNNDFNIIEKISIYPNPVNDVIYVKGNIEELNSIEVYSISGSKIMSINKNLGQIDVSQLQSGLYFLKLLSKDLLKTIKVVKN